MSERSAAEREAARREREIRRLMRAGEPVPPELREPVREAGPPPPLVPPPEPAAPAPSAAPEPPAADEQEPSAAPPPAADEPVPSAVPPLADEPALPPAAAPAPRDDTGEFAPAVAAASSSRTGDFGPPTDEHALHTDEHGRVGADTDEHALHTDEHGRVGADTDEHALHTDEHALHTDEHALHTDEHDLHDPWHDAPLEPLVAPAAAGGLSGVPPTAGPRAQGRGSRPPRRRRRLVFLGIGIAVLAVLAWFLVSLFQPFSTTGKTAVVVTIPAGASASDIGDLLEQKGVIDSSFFFGLRSRITGDRSKLRSGRFVLRQDMTYADALTALTTAPKAAKVTSVSIPEGLARTEIAPIAKHDGLTGSYVKASKTSPLLSPHAFGAPKGTENLEGFLFPATYDVKQGASVDALVSKQLVEFRKELADIPMAYAKKKNLTVYDIVTIASMIDRETAYPKDRARIAAVIYNRLKQGIPLGIDATTRYQYSNWQKPLTQSELASTSPYNTRRNKGLPPTPIGNPGSAALKAAASPAKKGYLYYVAKVCGEGASVFRTNYADFQKDVAAYQAARAKNGGNDPTHCHKK